MLCTKHFSLSAAGPWRWLPDQDVAGAAIAVEKARGLVRALRRISNIEVASKLAAVGAARSLFSFAPSFTSPPNAVNGVAALMCRHAKAMLRAG